MNRIEQIDVYAQIDIYLRFIYELHRLTIQITILGAKRKSKIL